MKKLFNKAVFKKVQTHIITTSKIVYDYGKNRYQTLNKRQRKRLLLGIGLISLTLAILSLSVNTPKAALKSSDPVHFETKAYRANQSPTQLIGPEFNPNRTRKLQSQLNQLEVATNQQYNGLKAQLQTIRFNMDSLASQRDILQLRQTVTQPNQTLLNKVARLQNSVQKIATQTAKKIWVNPQSVERYFRLIAVQGFSDGMRAIIDVDGHQTVLSTNEICPACRGWVLQGMDFANQTAVFSKPLDHQTFYVKLQTN